MRTPLGLLLLLAAGCEKEERDIPFWQDGMLLEGDCEDAGEQPQIADSAVLVNAIDPLIDLEGYPSHGKVIQDQQAYTDMMVDLNFGQFNAPDFTTDQVGAIFYDVDNGCALTIGRWDVLVRPSGGVVLDVTFNDTALNCPTACGLDTQAVLIASTPKDQPLGLCRRVVPGCDPQ